MLCSAWIPGLPLHLISSSELQGSNLLKVEFTKVRPRRFCSCREMKRWHNGWRDVVTVRQVKGKMGRRNTVPPLFCCGSAGRPKWAQLSEPVQQHRADAEGQLRALEGLTFKPCVLIRHDMFTYGCFRWNSLLWISCFTQRLCCPPLIT